MAPETFSDDLGAEQTSGVTFIASQTLPRHGMENALLRLANELRGDLDVAILAQKYQPDDTSAGVPVEVLARANHGRLRNLARTTLLLRRIMKRHNSREQAFVACGVWSAIPAIFAATGTDVRVIVWEHSLLDNRLTYDRSLKFLGWVAGHLYSRAEAVVCVSSCVADYVGSRSPNAHIRVIPNIVDSPARGRVFKRRSGLTDNVVLACVGSLRPIKNVSLVLSALTFLSRGYTLSVFGDGPERDALERQAYALGIGDRVTWHGYVDDVAQRLLLDVDILVHPSKVETFGFSLIESADSHVPAVVLDAPIMNELVPELVPGVIAADDPADFARAVREAGRLSADNFLKAHALRAKLFSRDVVAASWRQVLSSGGPVN